MSLRWLILQRINIYTSWYKYIIYTYCIYHKYKWLKSQNFKLICMFIKSLHIHVSICQCLLLVVLFKFTKKYQFFFFWKKRSWDNKWLTNCIVKSYCCLNWGGTYGCSYPLKLMNCVFKTLKSWKENLASVLWYFNY